MPSIRTAGPVSIRPMHSEDIDAVMKLAQRSPGSPHWTRGNFEQFEEISAVVLLAECEGQLAGFAAGSLVLEVCDLESVVVAEEFRRRGIATALLDGVTAWSRERGGLHIELEVRVSNHPAIALYERYGFVRDGVRRGYYSDPEEDALLMGLTFDSAGSAVEKNP
ncbi:ribosomal-protein-alanine N-acetyltransferase [Silvibacterium bohemicum]|uniref:Ribosomal-protein-alanine N-acetyltransferase n=1 Tax=Silvibacterium bohemicum TaxID=1577686 RepID=A0A841JXS1_9BACT|nr:ribosomal protein S18-alanine N-acetyltransferase [Silvibacterium bohemicum]MBB6143238.1 ribosomal-protein-alanine N-acetyltransferase [Silvibacterium bohemicum]